MFDSIIAKEGHKKIFLSFIAFLLFVIIECALLAFLSFVVFSFFIYAYRYKYVDFTSLKKEHIYAPISGKISAIDVKDFKKTIFIEVSLLDSHILRSLQNGEVKQTLKRGTNLFLGTLKAKRLNENVFLEYNDCSMQIYSSILNDSINLEKKSKAKKGEKIGVLINGQVIIDLDENYFVDVKIGQEIKSGETIIARLKSS